MQSGHARRLCGGSDLELPRGELRALPMWSDARANTFAGTVEALAQELPMKQGSILLRALTEDESQNEAVCWAAMWGFESA
jgi:hypothetical protein